MKDSSEKVPLEERLDFYLNVPRIAESVAITEEIYSGPRLMYDENKAVFSYKKYEGSFCEWYSRNLIHRSPFSKIRSLPKYEKYRNLLTLSDFLKLFHNASDQVKNADFLIYHGEKELQDMRPYIRKARKVEDQNGVLFKLSTIRHFFPCSEAKKGDIPWDRKKASVIWRGATTSEKYRDAFVKKYFNSYDIGFSTVKQNPELAVFQRRIVSIKEQLQYKFIVSLEGYDLASNLKWILASNSVPIMPKPTWVSWIMESKLVPYVHYLPLNDKLDNLDELLEWGRENDEECRRIARNGKEYMSQFFDEDNETGIQHELLERYSQLFKFNLSRT